MTIAIGSLTIDPPVLLAPMSGVTDLPFRRLVGGFGAGLVYSEMIASEAAVRESRRTARMLAHDRAGGPFAVQLAGCEPAVMAEAARLTVDAGAEIVDLNMGCPAKKVVRGAAGSALMRDERLAGRIIAAVVAAVAVPVTLKLRTGWDAASRNAPRLARIAEQEGVRLVTVHGRTRCQLYAGRADWGFVAAVSDALEIPVVVNGDIADAAAARAALAASGAAGVMIGRGARGRPWILDRVARALSARAPAPAPGLAERHAIVRRHYDDMLAHYGRERGIRIARKHVGWHVDGLPGAAAFRTAFNRIDDAGTALDSIDRFFRPLCERRAA